MAQRGRFQIPQNKQYPKNESGFVRVKQNSPCAVCGKTTWCTRSGDGVLAYCMRVAASSVKQLANKAYVHVLSANPSYVPQATVVKRSAPATVTASAETKDEVYRYLLTECLTLDADHGDHLLTERGLSDSAIVANLYASTPKVRDREAVSKQLADEFGDRLRGVAGCYIDPKTRAWRFRFPQDGFLIPCLNSRGQVAGLMVRRNGNADPKYYWVSTPTNDFEGGASSGTPIHFSQPHRIKTVRQVIVTEGILKADRITEFHDLPCIGIPGVHNFKPTFADDLKRLFPEIELALVAFDADFVTNPNVRDGLIKLLELMAPVFETRILKWNLSDGKGLDDVLFNEREVNE
ncbi:MAG: DUF3854 domain-containing protein [Acidobacteria bacterium]|nr:DUF3854 domain-containing protein [Acidobacteriota bacterium]